MKSYLIDWLIASALGLSALFVLAPDQDEKEAQKLLKATLAAAVKAHGKAMKGLVAPAKSVLQETKAAVSSGAAAPGDGVDALAGVVTSLDFALAEATNSTVLADVSIAVDTALTVAGLPLPAAALVGTGGVLDKRLATIEKRHRASVVKGRKASLAVLKALSKQGQPAALRAPDTPLPSFAPGFFGSVPTTEGSESAFVLPPLQLTALVGHSEGDDPGDGSLRISGFTLIDDVVKISGKGPDGSYFEPITVSPLEDGTFEASISGLPEGNWRVQALQAVALATDYVGIPGAPDPGTDALTAAQAAKEAKAGWKELVKQHGAAVKQQFKALKAALKDARKALKGGADPEAVLDQVDAALDTFQELVDAATNGAAGVGGEATASFGGALDGLDQLVGEQLVGLGLANDKAGAIIDKRLLVRAARAVKSARAFSSFLAKKTDWRMAVDLEPVPFRRAAPVKGPELPELLSPLRFESLMGTSRLGADDDGVIRLRISGNDEVSSRIDLALFGPDGYALVDTISAADTVGGLKLRYPEEGPGDLPEGNYVAVMRQGSVIVSAAVAVPGLE